MRAAAQFGMSPARLDRREERNGGFGVGGIGGLGGVGGAGGPGRLTGKWFLYDGELILSGKGAYDAKSPQLWLQSKRDYVAGRSDDLDVVLEWAENQASEIPMVPDQRSGQFPILDQCPVGPKEISRQVWAVLSPLVAGDASKDSTFKNVARHNGLEAWR